MIRRCASPIAANSSRKKVVVTNRAFNETYEHLSRHVEVVRNESTEPWSRKDLIYHAHDAHAIVAFMTDSCDRAMLDACPNLELIACALKGFDNFDIDLCAERGRGRHGRAGSVDGALLPSLRFSWHWRWVGGYSRGMKKCVRVHSRDGDLRCMAAAYPVQRWAFMV